MIIAGKSHLQAAFLRGVRHEAKVAQRARAAKEAAPAGHSGIGTTLS